MTEVAQPVRYEVWFRAERCVATCTTRKGARRSVDRRDNEYGAYVYRIRAVYADGSTHNMI